MSHPVCYVIVTTLCVAMVVPGQEPSAGRYSLDLRVTSELICTNTPMDPTIDFGKRIREDGLSGVLDPNSIRVVDASTGNEVPCAVSEDFAYADKGRVEWVIADPSHKDFVIRFRATDKRPPLLPAVFTPMVGVGDLLRYNAGTPRPFPVSYPSGLVDLTGDGKRDLVGCWNYAYRPGWPWDGIICHPRVGEEGNLEFGDLVRVRYVESDRSVGSDRSDKSDTAADFKHFSSIYMMADFADFNGDGLVDLVYSPRNGDQLHLYLNSGDRDKGGMPIFVASGSLARPASAWGPVRAVDLDQDGAMDLIACAVYGEGSKKSHEAFYLRNSHPDGWPIQPAEPVDLHLDKGPCFIDLDGDALLDAVSLVSVSTGGVYEDRLVWRRSLGGDPPAFGEPESPAGIDVHYPTHLAAVNDGPLRGLLLQHSLYQIVSFYEHVPTETAPATFKHAGRAQSPSAVMSFSDQAWPCICDWDDDGDPDLLIGGGYGWPRIVVNEGTKEKPAFAEPEFILSEGQPIKILRNDVLGEPKHWHNMGYSYPVYADWDGDGLPDLIVPNETNRIFWYKNIGTRVKPRFGPQKQVLVDGYSDSPELRKLSAERALDATYPTEEEQPFFWRTGAAVADWNGDGLMDLATHDGHTRKLTLFTQYRDEQGALHVKKAGPLKLDDGRLIDDVIVERAAHWTESFRPVDWDGDGLLDLVYACAGTDAAKGSIYLLRNVGTKQEPSFAAPRTMCCYGWPIKVTAHGPHPWPGDLDGDGKPDLLTCVEWSVYPFFTHAAIEMPERPTYELGKLRAE